MIEGGQHQGSFRFRLVWFILLFGVNACVGPTPAEEGGNSSNPSNTAGMSASSGQIQGGQTMLDAPNAVPDSGQARALDASGYNLVDALSPVADMAVRDHSDGAINPIDAAIQPSLDAGRSDANDAGLVLAQDAEVLPDSQFMVDASLPDMVLMPSCGNLRLDDGEACDDGNQVTEKCEYGVRACAVCSATCRLIDGETSFCGDGIRDEMNDEQCDDGNEVTETCPYGVENCEVCTDMCRKTNGQTSYCGDSQIDEINGENCDDGNAVTESCPYGVESCRVCSAQCREVDGTPSRCGDGRIDEAAGERCDDGNQVTEQCEYGAESCLVCNDQCQWVDGRTSYCGDRSIDLERGETCDDGNRVTEPCAYGEESCRICNENCQLVDGQTSYCGDRIIDLRGGERCDDGNRVTERCAYGEESCRICNENCQRVDGQTSYCGDGIIDIRGGERCDDGNRVTERCVYGELSCRVCDAHCRTADGATSFCGDGQIDASANESCDDGNRVTESCPYGSRGCLVCNALCRTVPGAVSFCGDGVVDVDAQEECDPGGVIQDECAYGLESCVLCSDACREIEAIGPFCGDGQPDLENGEDCDDANANESDRCTSNCQWNQPCEPLDNVCGDRNNWLPGLQEHYIRSTDGCVFGLDVPQNWDANSALIDELALAVGDSRDISAVLADLNRTAHSGVTNQSATRMRNHDWRGFVWNAGDMGVSYWYPQGITGSSDAVSSGLINQRRLIMVSWYNKTDARPTKGARISLVDYTDMANIRYRHLLLAEPIRVAGGVSFKQVEYDHGDRDALHAGGIVWFNQYLYVADTREGFRVFDLSRVMRIPNVNDSNRIGISGGQAHALGYRYIIPQLARYQPSDNACAYSFSAVGLDRSTDPPTMITSEYKSDNIHGRLVHWPLDTATGRLMDIQGQVRGRDAKVAAQTRMQGALSWQGDYYISSSSQAAQYGRLYRTRTGLQSRISAWVYGCEDLYYNRQTGRIWTAAEFPDFRDVIGIPLPRP